MALEPVNRDIQLGEYTSIAELANLMNASVASVTRVALERVGVLAAIARPLPFAQARAVAAEFGYRARRSL